MFTDIKVKRRDGTGKVIQEILIPIDFAAKSKMIRKVNEDKGLVQNVATTLPRMSFEITGLSRDPRAQQIPIIKNAHLIDGDHKNVRTNYMFYPYIMSFNLYVYVKNSDDGFQIFEQITPFFVPDWAIKVSLIDGMDYKDNIIIKMQDPSFTDNYEGAIDDRRMIIWTYPFTMQCRFYGPVKRTGLIKRVNVDLTIPEGKLEPGKYYGNTIPLSMLSVYPGLTANRTAHN